MPNNKKALPGAKLSKTALALSQASSMAGDIVSQCSTIRPDDSTSQAGAKCVVPENLRNAKTMPKEWAVFTREANKIEDSEGLLAGKCSTAAGKRKLFSKRLEMGRDI